MKLGVSGRDEAVALLRDLAADAPASGKPSASRPSSQ
jgi:hypothetical protein